jgi:hypothetical protein
MIILVVILSTLSFASLHLIKSKDNGYIRVKFGPLVFEYGKPPEAGDNAKTPDTPSPTGVEGGESDTSTSVGA